MPFHGDSVPRCAIPFLHVAFRCFSYATSFCALLSRSAAYQSYPVLFHFRVSRRNAAPMLSYTLPIHGDAILFTAFSAHCSSLPLLRTSHPCSSISRHCSALTFCAIPLLFAALLVRAVPLPFHAVQVFALRFRCFEIQFIAAAGQDFLVGKKDCFCVNFWNVSSVPARTFPSASIIV